MISIGVANKITIYNWQLLITAQRRSDTFMCASYLLIYIEIPICNNTRRGLNVIDSS